MFSIVKNKIQIVKKHKLTVKKNVYATYFSYELHLLKMTFYKMKKLLSCIFRIKHSYLKKINKKNIKKKNREVIM